MFTISRRKGIDLLRRSATVKVCSKDRGKTRFGTFFLFEGNAFRIQQMRAFSSEIPESNKFEERSENWLEELSKLVENGKVHDAQQMVERVDQKVPNGLNDVDGLDELRIILLNKWIEHQQKLFQDFMDMKQSGSSNAESNREHVIRICEAADAAHRLLEELEPFFSVRKIPRLDAAAPLEETGEPRAEERPTLPPKPMRDLTNTCEAVLNAWATASRAWYEARNDSHGIVNNIRAAQGIPQRAQFLLERMEVLSEASPGAPQQSVSRPSTTSYNHVLRAWVYSKEHLRGVMAERIFQKLSQSGVDCDAESFRQIIWAWALSVDKSAAFTATGHLTKMLRMLERGNTEMKPNLEDFKVVLRAWTRAEDKMSPSKAQSVLRLMDKHCRNGFPDLQPDRECFRCILQTAAKRPFLTDLGPLVDGVLVRMNELLITPDSDCYSAAIRTWRNAAIHPDLHVHRESSIRRAQELLEAMEATHQQTTVVNINIPRSTVHDVLECLALSQSGKKLEYAEGLLRKLEDVASQSTTSSTMWPTPDADSYRLVLDVVSSMTIHSNDEKIKKAKSIVERSEINDQLNRTSRTARIYNAFIRVCASCRKGGPGKDDGVNLLGEGIKVMEKMRTDGIAATSETYVDLLDAASKLLDDGQEKRRLVNYIFRFCCEDGMVNDEVLHQLMEVASADQYTNLVVAHGENMEGIKVVPEAWSRNALGGRVISFDGRKTRPLTIDGKVKVTIAMKEFRMRSIRDKRNRTLLRGGRLH